MKNKKKIIHILMSEYSVDSRVRNETDSLKKNFDVEVYCLNTSDTKASNVKNGVQLKRCGLQVKSKIIRILSAYVSMFLYALNKDIKVVHSHDLNALPVAFLIAKIKRVPLIYDSHELWSESVHEKYPRFVLSTVEKAEVMLAHRADHIITVSKSIADHLSALFSNKNISVVRNVPSYTHDGKFDLFREKYAISALDPIFIYQGLISESRGIRLIIDALKMTDKELNFYFVFLGDGEFKEELRRLVSESDLSQHVFVENSVSQDVLLKYTSSADIGVHALDNSCLNHEYCLPNKIFEYLHAGIGVICPDLVELKSFVKSEKVGSTYGCGDASLLAKTIEHYIRNPDLIKKVKNAADISKRQLNWDTEEAVLLGAYDKII
jgi:glycosyltransferase involved in cell wall biosynthesis